MMKLSPFLIALALLSAATAGHARNPFEPPGSPKSPGAIQPAPAIAGELPPLVLPPPAPPPRSAPIPAIPQAPEEPAPKTADSKTTKGKKESRTVRAQATCDLKPKSTIVAAPAYGGPVTIAMQVSGGRECLSAVLAEQSWVEVRDLSDPSAVTVDVEPNDSGAPRQSKVTLANTADSVTVTLMQEGRERRNK